MQPVGIKFHIFIQKDEGKDHMVLMKTRVLHQFDFIDV